MSSWLPSIIVVVLYCCIAGLGFCGYRAIGLLRRWLYVRRRKREQEADYRFQSIYHAIKRSDLIGLRRALESGVNANLVDRHGISLLMSAAMTGNVGAGELLISKGAKVNQTSERGWTAIAAALNGRHIRFLKLLFEHGADPNSTWAGRPIEDWLRHYSLSPKAVSAVRELLQRYREAGLDIRT